MYAPCKEFREKSVEVIPSNWNEKMNGIGFYPTKSKNISQLIKKRTPPVKSGPNAWKVFDILRVLPCESKLYIHIKF